MPPPNKRKRDGIDASRPSPHKPTDQHTFARDRDEGNGRRNRRRPDRRESNSRGNPNAISLHAQTANSQHGLNSDREAQRGPSPSPSTALGSSRPVSASSQVTPQSATGPGLNFGGSNLAVSNTSFTMTAPATPASAAIKTQPEPPTSVPAPFVPFDDSIQHFYLHLTDELLQQWKAGGRDDIIAPIAEAVQSGDYHKLTYWTKDIVFSVLSGRLQPVEAGEALQKIIGPPPSGEAEDRFAFEPHAHFTDSLTLMFEYNMDLYRPQLLHFLKATGVRPQMLRELCETPLLIKLGLIRETFPKLSIRHATNQLYRQANYNLLREETEGYSKLMTELFATGNSGPPTGKLVRDTFERIKALIGTFDMDVGRVLDIILDVFASVLIKHFQFYVKLLRSSSWWPRVEPSDGTFRGGLPHWALPDSQEWQTTEVDEVKLAVQRRERDIKFWNRAREIHTRAFFELGGRQVADEESQGSMYSDVDTAAEVEARRNWIKVTNTLPAPGNRTAAQLLGFKLRFYTSEARNEDDVLPANLLYLSALLIKIGFISLSDLMAHLWPDDSGMQTLRSAKLKEMEEKEQATRGGGMNALAMAAALPDDGPATSSSSKPRESQKSAEEAKAAEGKPKLPEPSEQKVGLLTSLLTIGAIPEALFMIGSYPWILETHPEVLDRIHRICHHSIDEIYDTSKPTCRQDNAKCTPRDVITDDQIAAPKGHIKMEKFVPRRPLRWPFPDTCDTKDNSQYRFYWSEWADNVPVCRTVDDVFTLCDTLLNISGVNIGKDSSLLTKLARIGVWSLRTDKSSANSDRWQELLRRLLVPALSMTSANPSIANSVWELLKMYPMQVRYRIYADWYEGPISRLPVIRNAFSRTRLDTLRSMKRLSLDNLSQMAKTLAKSSYSSPGIVFKVALDQIEAYANLIEAFVECAKYFTELAYDVLIWSLLSSLGGGSRSRHQESSVLLTSKWLQALSRFSGKVFRRCPIMSPTPVLRYVNHQLSSGNSTDLIILKELITTMGGIVPTLDFTDDQIIGMTGYATLRRQTLINGMDKRFESAKSSKRLVQSLLESRLASKLLVNIVRFRQNAIFQLDSDQLHVKFLSALVDDSHQILIQYLDFLGHNMDHEQYCELLPSLKLLMGKHKLDAALTFMLIRPSISFDVLKSEPVVEADGDVEMTDAPKEILATTNAVHDTLKPLIESISVTQKPEFWSNISPEFFTTFWALQLGDISVPDSRYEREYSRTVIMSKEVSKDRFDMTHAGITRRAEKMKALADVAEQLSTEKKQHRLAFAKLKALLNERTNNWFLGAMTSPNGISDALIQDCFFPRVMLSPTDAEYTYQMIRFLHDNNVPGFRLQALYDRLFNANRLRSMLFVCTVREVENLGRFLKAILADLAKWHKDKATFELEALGIAKGTNAQTLNGFASAFDADGKPTAWLEYIQFKDILWGWHKSINTALKGAMTGMEWLHIRNAITVLKCVLDYFPSVDFMARQFAAQLKAIAERESGSGPNSEGHRVDLSVAAQTALSELQRRSTKWVMVQSFRANMTADPCIPDSSKSILRLTAVEFKSDKVVDRKNNLTIAGVPKPNSGNDAEDGEVRDLPERRLPAKQVMPPANIPKKPELAANIPSAPSRSSLGRVNLLDRVASGTVPGLPSRPPPPSSSRNQARESSRDQRPRDSARDSREEGRDRDRHRDRDSRNNALEHGRLERPSVRDLPQLPERRLPDNSSRDKDQSSSSRREDRESRVGRERNSHRGRDEPSSTAQVPPAEPPINPARAAAILGTQIQEPSVASGQQSSRSSGSRREESRSDRRGHSPRRDRDRAEVDSSREDRHTRDKENRSSRDGRSDSARPDRREVKESDRSDSHRDSKDTPSRNDRNDRETEIRPPEQSFGRLSQAQAQSESIPSGPRANRGRGNGRNVVPSSGIITTPVPNGTINGNLPMNSVTNTPTPSQRHERFQNSNTDNRRPGTPEGLPPTGPASNRRGRGPGGHDSNIPPRPVNTNSNAATNTPSGPNERHRQMPPTGPANGSAPMIHPDRLQNLPTNTTQLPPTLPGGPRGDGYNNSRTSEAYGNVVDLTPSGPLPPRSRPGGGQRQLAGINNTLQQAQNDRSRRQNNPPRVPLGPEPTAPTGPAADAERDRSRAPANTEDHRSSNRPDRDRRDRDRGDRNRRGNRESSRDRQRDRAPRERDHRERSPDRVDREKDPRDYRERGGDRSGRSEISVPPPPPGQPPRDSRRGGRDRDHRHNRGGDGRQSMGGGNANMIPLSSMGGSQGAPNGPKAQMGPAGGVNAAPLGNQNQGGNMNGGNAEREKQRSRR